MVTSNDFEAKIAELEQWFKLHKWLPEKIDSILLRRYLYSTQCDIEVAKKLIENSYTLRNKSPNIFANRDACGEVSKKVFQITDIGVPMPKLTSKNYRIIYNRLIDHDAEKFHFDDIIKTFFLVADYRFSKPDEDLPFKVNDGDVPVFDMTGFSYRHLTKLSFFTLRTYMRFTQEAFPTRLKNIHLVNVSPVVSKVLTILRPFMKARVRDLMMFHTPNSTTLFDHIPRECVPVEYGGEGPSLTDLKKTLVNEIGNKREYLSSDSFWKFKDANNNNNNISDSSVVVEKLNIGDLNID